MTTQPASGKICFVCGADVAKKPRAKDERGRYMCQGACEQKAREMARAAAAKKPAEVKPVAATAQADDGDMMANLLDASPAVSVQACPGCGSQMPGGALVCMNCGYNARIGKAAKTKVVKMPKASQMPVPRASRYSSDSAGTSFWKTLLVCSLVLGGVGFLPLAGQSGFTLAIVVLVLAALAAWIGGTAAAFKNGQTLWGVCGVIMIVPIANIVGVIGFFIYNLLFNQDSLSRALYWAHFVGSFAFGIAMGAAMAMGHQFEFLGVPLSGQAP